LVARREGKAKGPGGDHCIHRCPGPPNLHDINVATNVMYNIPIPIIFDPNMPISPCLPLTLTLEIKGIRETILEKS